MKVYDHYGFLLKELPDAIIVLTDGTQIRIAEIGVAEDKHLAVQTTSKESVQIFGIDKAWVEPKRFPA